jgi:hypothetical protein
MVYQVFSLNELGKSPAEAIRKELEATAISDTLSLDDKILFWAHHFNGQDWAVYPNGTKKGGTIRYKEGAIRIPAKQELPVYETKEFQAGKPPRAIVTLDKIYVVTAKFIPPELLPLDGYKSTAEMVESMREYYPNMSSESTISFYQFAKTQWGKK